MVSVVIGLFGLLESEVKKVVGRGMCLVLTGFGKCWQGVFGALDDVVDGGTDDIGEEYHECPSEFIIWGGVRFSETIDEHPNPEGCRCDDEGK
jgi:hypothetical protein